MKILSTLSKDAHNRFNVIIATNLLRCKMLNIYDKILRDYPVEEGHVRSRKEEIFDRFISMINERGQSHRDVAYYASRLCISSRYLCSIVREVASEQPKEIIDRHLVMEIKLLLTFSDLSIQQIADRLEFPDQSYMGRFFRRATGMSPLAYRKNEITM
ncbi:MAG: helix-turn-helix domain-containing protein [Candidatus Cryptobacteroides sp.]|nr:helix-turn-helix domain-containing protein [Candidatus Cryptobacteroides sp.]